MLVISANTLQKVHCHVGSLEKRSIAEESSERVHCHVGSLEIDKVA